MLDVMRFEGEDEESKLMRFSEEAEQSKLMRFDGEVEKLKLGDLPEHLEKDEVLIDQPAYCLHCGEEISLMGVLENDEGDRCPNFERCGGSGWGVDLFLDRWWEGEDSGEESSRE